MKLIPLTQSKFAIVDDCDYEILSKYKWHASQGKYAVTWSREGNGNRYQIKMHRLILELTDNAFQVDHIDGNGLNNLRSNLRICNGSENLRNRGKQKNNKSGFKGVNFHRQTKKWRSEICIKGKSYHLGLFITPELAHEAYKKSSIELHGEFARAE